MGFELDIDRELATLSATLIEFTSIYNTIHAAIRDETFRHHFYAIAVAMDQAYAVVNDNLQPFSQLHSETEFTQSFDKRHQDYSERYLKEISKPRFYCEEAYEAHLILKSLKQSQTRFPLLKRSFERLDHYIDKWVNNDVWLAMSVDNLFKRLQLLFKEIASLKEKDSEDAYLIFDTAMSGFSPYLLMLEAWRPSLAAPQAKSA